MCCAPRGAQPAGELLEWAEECAARTVLLGPVAERPPLLGRDAHGERRLQEQPGLPSEPEEFFCFEARAQGSPGPVDSDDGDDGDDDDGDDSSEEYDDYDDDEEDDGVFPARVSPQEGLGAPCFPRGGAVRLRAPVTPQVPGV